MITSIAGRQSEKEILERIFRSGRAEFVAVYGRRRVGKTFLIEEYFEESLIFSFAGGEHASDAQNLERFSYRVGQFTGKPVKTVQSWFEALDMLEDVIISSQLKRKVVFLDEVPWIAETGSDFVTALEMFWNNWAHRRRDLVLIVCGSAASWMLDNIVNEHGGLYGRLTRQMNIQPFNLSDCEQFLHMSGIRLTRSQITMLYMIFGGIPYYLYAIDKGESVEQFVDRMIFAKNAPLKSEFHRLYASMFRKPDEYEKIIMLLAENQKGLTRIEIADRLGVIPGGTLTKNLRELELCCVIEGQNLFKHKTKEKRYKIIDFFTLFYYRHLIDKKIDDTAYWSNMSRTGNQYAWYGLNFERVCMRHIAQIRQRLGIGGVKCECSNWKGPGAQIDLVIDRDDGIIDLNECKFTKDQYNVSEEIADLFERKAARFKEDTGTTKALHTVLISANGVDDASFMGSIQKLITLDDLFAPTMEF